MLLLHLPRLPSHLSDLSVLQAQIRDASGRFAKILPLPPVPAEPGLRTYLAAIAM
jgi:hypothetical protein